MAGAWKVTALSWNERFGVYVLLERALNQQTPRAMEVVGYRLKVRTRRDGREWLAWSPALDVMTQARTKRGALESLRQAIKAWFESSIDRGVLEAALREVGFARQPGG